MDALLFIGCIVSGTFFLMIAVKFLMTDSEELRRKLDSYDDE